MTMHTIVIDVLHNILDRKSYLKNNLIKLKMNLAGLVFPPYKL